MNDEHEHKWEPVEGFSGRYVCQCGATGYRQNNGQIVPHKSVKKYSLDPKIHVGKSNLGEGTARRGKRGPGGW